MGQQERYKDTGCEFYPKCLECPFPKCILDEENYLREFIHQTRLEAVAVLTNSKLLKKIYNIEQIAKALNLSNNRVKRLLNELKKRR